MSDLLFGEKNVFAIEVEVADVDRKKGRIRFWIEGKPMGTFKRQHTFSYFLKAMKKMLDEVFFRMPDSFFEQSPEKIINDSLLTIKKFEDFTVDDYAHIERLRRYSPYFGDQLDSINLMVFTNRESYIFIWAVDEDYSGPKKSRIFHNVLSAKVDIAYFKKITLEALMWFAENKDQVIESGTDQ